MINWIKTSEQKPEDGQDCITDMKHGVIQGRWDASEGTFNGYYWRDIEWFASRWAPISEANPQA